MLVVDASVVVVALTDDGPAGDLARARLRDAELAAPQMVDLEVASVLRRRQLGGALDDRRCRLALRDLADLPLQRAPHQPLVPRCWELRSNITIHDAAYVALAEAARAPLLTFDARRTAAPGPRREIDVLR